MLEKWIVRQFLIVMTLCLVVMTAGGVYSIFIDFLDWKYIFKPIQIALIISGFIMIIDLLIDKSK